MKNIFDMRLVEKFRKLLDEHDKIILTCHMRPDGDAIGSTLGLWHLLRSLGKEASVVIPDRIPRSLSFLPGSADIAVFSCHDPYCTRLVEEAGLIIMCDFNTASRQGDLAPLIQGADCAKVLIDHHKDPDMPCDVQFSYPELSSTCELAFRLIAALGLYNDLDTDGATCLLTGLITDTQNFTVNCPDNEIYEVLMYLLDKGVDKRRIIDEAVNSCTLDALRLNSFALLERLEVLDRHKCALICLSASDLEKFDYQKGDTEGLVNKPLNIRGVVYSIFMREDSDCIKVSARSRYDFPVIDICRDLFNGGGHLMASGGEFYGTLEECRDIFLKNIDKYDKFLPSSDKRQK